MTLDNQDEVAKALGVPSLEGLSTENVTELVELLKEMPEDLQLQIIKSNPELQKYALEAVAAVEDDLRATLLAINTNNQQAFAALAEIREVIAGEISKEDISDERWRYLMDTLVENGKTAVAVGSEANQLIAQQADATRLTKLAVAAMPYIETVINVGVRILISRSRI